MCCDLGFSRLITYPGLASFAVDRPYMMCVDRCLSLIVDLRTGSMGSYELLLILSPKCIKITIFLQNTPELVNILKRLQTIINSS